MRASVRAAERPRVDVVVRSDAPAKPGGDTHQVGRYAAMLEAAGFDVVTVPYAPGFRPRPGAVVHLSNVDRTFELLGAALAARGHALVVASLHRDAEHFRQMLRTWNQSPRAALLGGLPPHLRELAVFVVRCGVRSPAPARHRLRAVGSALRRARGWQAAVAGVLDRADAVLLLAEAERATLTRDLGWHGRNGVVVPNAVGLPDPPPASLPWARRPVGSLAFVGRIEPGKRPLELAREAGPRGMRVDFYGAPGTNGRYTAAFAEEVSRHESLRWSGRSVSQEELHRRLGRTRVLVNASLLEVQSLADLEAAACGCVVVSTPAGHSDSVLGARTLVKLDTFDIAPLLDRAEEVAAAPQGPGAAGVPRWSDLEADVVRVFAAAAAHGPKRLT